MNFVLLIGPLNIVNLFGDDVLHSVLSFRFFFLNCFLLCMDKFISVNCDCLVVVIVIIFF